MRRFQKRVLCGFLVVFFKVAKCDIRPLSNIELQSKSPLMRIDPDCPPLQPPMDNMTQEEFISKLTASCRYDRLIKPPTDSPLKVEVQIDVQHIESADNLQFISHLLVQQRFKDQRLNYEQLSPSRGDIMGLQPLRNKIWVPHIIIKNERSSGLMGLDSKDVYVKISPQGEVIYSYRMTTTFYCWMDLRKFPFDHQLCQIVWASWSYNKSSLELHWMKDNPYYMAEDLHLTEFLLDGVWVDSGVLTSAQPNENEYSYIIFKFRLKREVGYYVLEYFLPSIMLVIMSWVTFWIQADAAPARTTLGTATMLSFITLNGSVTRNLPKVSYIKASEIWFLGGATFIFCSLAEFTFVNVIWRRKKTVELAKHSSKYIIKGALSPRLARKDLRKSESFSSLDSKHGGTYLTVHGSSNSLNVPTINPPIGPPNGGSGNPNGDSDPPTPITPTPTWAEMTPQEVSIWIDRKARVAFPVMFLIYNLFYWSFVYAL